MYACPICLEPLTEAICPPCGHIYCGKCLRRHSVANGVVKPDGVMRAPCPTCRRDFEIDQLRPLYGLDDIKPPTSDIDTFESKLEKVGNHIMNLAEARLKRAEEERELAEAKAGLEREKELRELAELHLESKELELKREKELRELAELHLKREKEKRELAEAIQLNLERMCGDWEIQLKKSLDENITRTDNALDIMRMATELKRENEELKRRLKDGRACTCGNTTELTDTRVMHPSSCKDDHEGGGCLHGGGRGGGCLHGGGRCGGRGSGGGRGGDGRCRCGNQLKKPWHFECPRCHNSKFL